MMKKRVKEGSAIFLALAVAFSIFVLPGVWAADAIDVDRKDCSVEFSVGGTYEELKTSDLMVNLYKVASVDKTGTYTPVKDFDTLDLSELSMEDAAASAAQWQDRAKAAEEMLTDSILPTKETVIHNGTAEVRDLETGLYLVQVDQLVTANHVYTFTPYLIALPNNYYGQGKSDTWVYNLTGENAIGLKPEQQPRSGDLVITKKLVNQNVTFGDQATFVFQIDIVNPDRTTACRVEALTFDAAGEQSARITGLPAGAAVTVTEVYSGASYRLTSENGVQTTILANDAYSEADAPVAEVTFINEDDGRINGGYGVINHFELDENGQYQYTGADPR